MLRGASPKNPRAPRARCVTARLSGHARPRAGTGGRSAAAEWAEGGESGEAAGARGDHTRASLSHFAPSRAAPVRRAPPA